VNHHVKPIMGRQLPTPTPTATPPISNNLQEECIRVNKVYDWVVLANSYRNKIAIPDDCRALVDAAIRAGQDISFSCVEPVTPAPTCSVVGIRRETIVVGGTTVRVGVVHFVFSATVQLTVFADGTPLCTFTTTVQFDQEVVLCLPEPLDEDNIVCRISAIECNPTGSVLLGGMVQLDVIVCVEIQVEAEVKLEVLAKFCSPRPNTIPVPSPTPSFRCPPIVFPPQCPPIFPVRNCDCQASVNALVPNVSISLGIPLTVAIGTIQLIADICPSCDPSSSSFTFNFFDNVLPDIPAGDQSFSFSPTSISSPTCITVLPGLAILTGLTVTGSGVRTFTSSGAQDTLTYSLTLAETGLGLPDIMILTLTDQSGVLVFTATITVIPDEQLLVRDCVTFGDIVITTP